MLMCLGCFGFADFMICSSIEEEAGGRDLLDGHGRRGIVLGRWFHYLVLSPSRYGGNQIDMTCVNPSFSASEANGTLTFGSLSSTERATGRCLMQVLGIGHH